MNIYHDTVNQNSWYLNASAYCVAARRAVEFYRSDHVGVETLPLLQIKIVLIARNMTWEEFKAKEQVVDRILDDG